jgi:HEAT repeat protein
MNKKRLLLSLAALALIVSGALMLHPYPRQMVFGPKYNGVPLWVWQEDYRGHTLELLGRDQKTDSLIAKILDWINHGRKSRDWAVLSSEEIEIIYLTLVDDPEPGIRRYLVLNLAPFKTKTAFAALVRFMDDPEFDVFNAVCEHFQGNEELFNVAYPKLISLLDHPDFERRILALENILRYSPQDAYCMEIVPLLLRLLHDPAVSVRKAALCVFASCPCTKKIMATALPELTECLKDENAACQVAAARAVWHFTRDTAKAFPIFRREINNPDANVRIKAIQGLKEIGKDALPAWDELVNRALNDPNIEVRGEAIDTLFLGGGKAVPLLISLLGEEEERLQQKAVWSLMLIGPEAKDAVPFLLPRAQKWDDFSLNALWAINEKNNVPALLAMLEQAISFRSNKYFALEAKLMRILGSLGEDAKAALPKLEETFSHPEIGVRWPAGVALFQINGDAPRFNAFFQQILEEWGTESCWSFGWMREGFNLLGPLAKESVPLLRKSLRIQRDNHPFRVAYCLGCIGPDAKSAIPDLLPLLKEARGKLDIPEVLGQIGQDAPKVIPALLPLLHDKDYAVRQSVCKGLAYFGSEAHEAIPILAALLNDDFDDVRAAAADALAAIDPDRFPKKANGL